MCCKNEKSLQINNCWTWLPCVLVYMWSPPAFHPHKSQPRIDIFWNILLIYKLQEFNPEYFWQNVFTMSSVDCAWNYAFWHLYLVSFLLLQYSRLREGQFLWLFILWRTSIFEEEEKLFEPYYSRLSWSWCPCVPSVNCVRHVFPSSCSWRQ